MQTASRQRHYTHREVNRECQIFDLCDRRPSKQAIGSRLRRPYVSSVIQFPRQENISGPCRAPIRPSRRIGPAIAEQTFRASLPIGFRGAPGPDIRGGGNRHCAANGAFTTAQRRPFPSSVRVICRASRSRPAQDQYPALLCVEEFPSRHSPKSTNASSWKHSS